MFCMAYFVLVWLSNSIKETLTASVYKDCPSLFNHGVVSEQVWWRPKMTRDIVFIVIILDIFFIVHDSSPKLQHIMLSLFKKNVKNFIAIHLEYQSTILYFLS